MPRKQAKGVLEEFLVNGEKRDPRTIKDFRITIRYPNGERATIGFNNSLVMFDDADRKLAKKLGIN